MSLLDQIFVEYVKIEGDQFTDAKGFEIRNQIGQYDIVTRRHDFRIEKEERHTYYTIIFDLEVETRSPMGTPLADPDYILECIRNTEFEMAIKTHLGVLNYFKSITRKECW